MFTTNEELSMLSREQTTYHLLIKAIHNDDMDAIREYISTEGVIDNNKFLSFMELGKDEAQSNDPNTKYDTALKVAAIHAKEAICRFIIDQAMETEEGKMLLARQLAQKDHSYKTLLHHAILWERDIKNAVTNEMQHDDNVPVINMLCRLAPTLSHYYPSLENYIAIEDGMYGSTALHSACKLANYENAIALMQHGASLMTLSSGSAEHPAQTALDIVKYADPNMASKFMSNLINRTDEAAAIFEGRHKVSHRLLSHEVFEAILLLDNLLDIASATNTKVALQAFSKLYFPLLENVSSLAGDHPDRLAIQNYLANDAYDEKVPFKYSFLVMKLELAQNLNEPLRGEMVANLIRELQNIDYLALVSNKQDIKYIFNANVRQDIDSIIDNQDLSPMQRTSLLTSYLIADALGKMPIISHPLCNENFFRCSSIIAEQFPKVALDNFSRIDREMLFTTSDNEYKFAFNITCAFIKDKIENLQTELPEAKKASKSLKGIFGLKKVKSPMQIESSINQLSQVIDDLKMNCAVLSDIPARITKLLDKNHGSYTFEVKQTLGAIMSRDFAAQPVASHSMK
jgi:hypothetical protein